MKKLLLLILMLPLALPVVAQSTNRYPVADKNDVVRWNFVKRADLAGFLVGLFPLDSTNALTFLQLPVTNRFSFTQVPNMPPRGDYRLRWIAFDTNAPPRTTPWTEPLLFTWEPEPPLEQPTGFIIIHLPEVDTVITVTSTNISGTNTVTIP